jgi:hypothetical protein
MKSTTRNISPVSKPSKKPPNKPIVARARGLITSSITICSDVILIMRIPNAEAINA